MASGDPVPYSGHITHEQYIHAVREIVISRLNDEDERRRALAAKLVYGSGSYGLRGTCYFESWEDGQKCDLIEVCAFGEESSVQLAGTTIHELAHAVAGYAAGHGSAWKTAASKMGLIRANAAGQNYQPTHFDKLVWSRIEGLPLPSDGQPAFYKQDLTRATTTTAARPCAAAVGTRGGSSRGPGSGSRLIKAMCPDCAYSIWTTQKWLNLGTPVCVCDARMVEVPK